MAWRVTRGLYAMFGYQIYQLNRKSMILWIPDWINQDPSSKCQFSKSVLHGVSTQKWSCSENITFTIAKLTHIAKYRKVYACMDIKQTCVPWQLNRARRQSGFPTIISCQRQDVNMLPKRQQSHKGDKLCDVSTVPLVARWPIFLARGSDADGEPHFRYIHKSAFKHAVTDMKMLMTSSQLWLTLGKFCDIIVSVWKTYMHILHKVLSFHYNQSSKSCFI